MVLCFLKDISYWDGSSASERGRFEHDLYLQSRPEWAELKPSKEDADKVDQFKPHISLVEYPPRKWR